ncbi:thiol reductant ABC exporter subunit CydD [Alkalihalobacillus sp. LMS39]|uniref:thiol reductant ABC exporter subunit CydD n=1 Tax=Alkalihalobacillus sp. LMS39 TaxID=2924032 RepID=UPI001FB36394|nr:thiol reductant ABC exporter subunit CydD [Alkalihalobacillus sp. LMS39]UOE94573.1 thiol reductant ABC exporter subunit CydD [Alkalihalobacillus sp. LMS39]
MKSLQKLAKAQKRRFYTLYGIALFISVVIVLQAFFIVSIIDDLFLHNGTLQENIGLIICLLAVLLLRVLLSYYHRDIGTKMAATVKQDFRKRLLQVYSEQTLLAAYHGQSGKKVSVLLDAVDEIGPFFRQYVPQKILSSIVPIVILIVIFTQNVYSGLIIVVTAPFIPIFMIIIGGATQKKSEEQLDRLAAFSGRFLDTVQGLVSLKLFGRAKQYRNVIKQSSLDFRDSTMNILKIAFTSSLMLEFISMLSIGLVALELGLRLVVFDSISFFAAFFILLLVPEFYSSLKELGSAFHAGRSSVGASEKIEEQLQQSEQRKSWGQLPLKEGPISLALHDTSFSYGDTAFQLQSVSAKIKPNSQVAIVGKSGSGKTTLLHLIAGLLQPNEGSVSVNGQNRHEVREKEWFKQISYITQHPYLFSGTMAQNIALGVEATQAEIEAAAKKAGISSLIDSFEQGYETQIGEGGRGLSGGEKQRVALARAFLKKPALILFDEPTTGLDLYTEQKLQAAINELSKTSTIITVAHRLQSIVQADDVFFLEHGRLVANGTHQQLIEQCSEYKKLFSNREKGEQK